VARRRSATMLPRSGLRPTRTAPTRAAHSSSPVTVQHRRVQHQASRRPRVRARRSLRRGMPRRLYPGGSDERERRDPDRQSGQRRSCNSEQHLGG
jgi:hypothetical protein